MTTRGSGNVFARVFIALAATVLGVHGHVFTIALDLHLSASFDEYLVVAALSPGGLGLWFLALAAWLVAGAYHSAPPKNGRPAGLFRRFVAFCIDFMICFYLMTIIAVAAVILLETLHTGAFSWRVERNEAHSTDVVAFGIVSVAFLGILVLFAAPAWRGRQSPGGIVAGVFLRRAAPLTLGQAVGRAFLGYVSLCAMFISVPMALMRDDRRMWHDLYFGTSVQKG